MFFQFFLVYCLLSVVCCLPSFASPGDYVWPLGQEAPITGTFGEYREGHFHTGIDFSTGGENGKPVYAVADGEVYRLADSLTGFGKAVYIRHVDGNRSVYAHLDRFDEPIASWVRKKRKGLRFRDKLDTDVDPGSIPPIRRGRRIGFSGESGAGLPHLHFEMRRDEQTPIHPFEFLPHPTDRTSPQILSLNFIPVSSGRFWVHLSATDIHERSAGHRLSPRRIIYAVDRRDTRTIQFDRLIYADQENKKVGLIYDLNTAAHPGLYIFRLFTSLPRPRAPSADPVTALDASMAEDTHRLWVRVEDINGNASETDVIVPLMVSLSNHSQTETLTSSDARVLCVLSPEMLYSHDPVTLSDFVMTFPGADTSPPPQASLPVGRVYSFEPGGVPLASAATLKFKAPKSARVPIAKMAVYRLSSSLGERNKWKFVEAIPVDVGDSGTVSAKIDRLAVYALFDDSVPPVITLPKKFAHAVGDEIRIPAADAGSGMADTGSVELDGKIHERWYYDADRGWVRIFLSGVGRGKHRAAVTLSDRLGNITRKEWSFMVRQAHHER